MHQCVNRNRWAILRLAVFVTSVGLLLSYASAYDILLLKIITSAKEIVILICLLVC